MKVTKFIVENYKAIRGRKEFDPKGASFFLIGGNGQGKTSAGRAMMDLLTKSLPSRPVTEGEKEGYVEFRFDDGSLLYARMSENGRTKIEFVTSDGLKVGAPRDLLQLLTGDAAKFSIDDFMSMAPKPRREMLEKITGVDFSEINDEEKEAFDHRTIVKRQLADQQARVQPYDKELVKKDPIDASALNEELEEIMERKHKRIELSGHAHSRKERIESITNQIEELKRKLAYSNQALSETEKEIESIPEVDHSRVADLRNQINSASDTNQAISDAKRMHEEFQVAMSLEEKVGSAEDKVKQIRERKERLLRENKLPADGLEWSEDGQTLLLDSLPFESNQIATSKKVIAGLQIAESMMGKIRYAHFDASILDRNHAAQVLDWAESKGLQLCLERALWEGGELKFEVVDETMRHELVEAV